MKALVVLIAVLIVIAFVCVAIEIVGIIKDARSHYRLAILAQALKTKEEYRKEYLEALDVTAWRYDEPPRDDWITGMFFVVPPYKDDGMSIEPVSVFWCESTWSDIGGNEHKDCRLLCWKPIDWSV